MKARSARALRLVAVALAAPWCRPAAAQTPPGDSAPPSDSTPADARTSSTFADGVRGAIAEVAVGTSWVGDDLLAALGVEWQGIQTWSDPRWLLSWDVSLALRAGYLANQHPYLFLIGPRAAGYLEAGYRFEPGSGASPYGGLRLADEVQLLGHPGRPLSDFKTMNAVDGVGGAVARTALRADFGVSLLEHQRSLLGVAFLEETLQALQVNTEALALTSGGIALRGDWRMGLSASLEASYGIAPARHEALLGLSDTLHRFGARTNVRWRFRKGSWLGLRLGLSRDTDRLSYAGGRSYSTASAPVFDAAFVFGLPIGGGNP